MTLVPITIKVEEAQFFPVMRLLKSFPGVVDLIFNIDEIEDGKRKPKSKANGFNPQPVEKSQPGGLKALMMGLLFRGPQHLAVLRQAVVREGFKEGSINSVLHELRTNGVTESGGVGIHKLTDKVMAELQGDTQPEPRRALPPPAKAGSTEKGPASPVGATMTIVMRLLKETSEGRSSRPILVQAVTTAGLSPRSIDGALYRGCEKGLIKAEGDGVYQLTAKGRRLELPPAS